MAITPQETEEELVAILAPFVKGFPEGSDRLVFRKKLSGSEVEQLLDSLYELTKKVAA